MKFLGFTIFVKYLGVQMVACQDIPSEVKKQIFFILCFPPWRRRKKKKKHWEGLFWDFWSSIFYWIWKNWKNHSKSHVAWCEGLPALSRAQSLKRALGQLQAISVGKGSFVRFLTGSSGKMHRRPGICKKKKKKRSCHLGAFMDQVTVLL